MTKQTKTSLLVLLAGIAAVVVGTFLQVTMKNQAARDTEPATATVVGYEEGLEHNSTTDTEDTVLYPVLSYEVNGETVESRYSQYDYSETYAVGSSVDIKYNPDNPEEYYIVGDKAFESPFVFAIPVGAVLMVGGLVGIVLPKVNGKKKQ